MKTSLQKRGGYKPWVYGLSRRKKLNPRVKCYPESLGQILSSFNFCTVFG